MFSKEWQTVYLCDYSDMITVKMCRPTHWVMFDDSASVFEEKLTKNHVTAVIQHLKLLRQRFVRTNVYKSEKQKQT